MKKIFYLLWNRSLSVGQYLMDDEYHYLNQGEKITLNRRPTNWTQNIELSMFKKEVPDQSESTNDEVTSNKLTKVKQNKKKGD